MRLDNNVVAVSPSSIYKILSSAGLLKKWNRSKTKKRNGLVQPVHVHDHWQIDVSYINICGTFYSLRSILDCYSRFIIHWELRELMTKQDIEIVLQGRRVKIS